MEKILVYKTKLLLKLHKEAQVLENLKSGNLLEKSEFFSWCVWKLENSQKEGTKVALLTYISRYPCCKGERIDGIFFIIRNMTDL